MKGYKPMKNVIFINKEYIISQIFEYFKFIFQLRPKIYWIIVIIDLFVYALHYALHTITHNCTCYYYEDPQINIITYR